MFGRHKKGKPELTSTNVEYLGGHPLYPKSFYGWAEFMSDRLEIKRRIKDAPEIMIPYNQITKIENSKESRFDVDRLVSFGPAGLIEKKHIYTLIHTHFNNTAIVIGIDFSGKVEEAQRILYKKKEPDKRVE